MDMQQTRDLMTYIDPENGNLLADEVLPKLFAHAPLGVACHTVACSWCGSLYVSFHAVPIRTPIECPKCHYKQGYLQEELH